MLHGVRRVIRYGGLSYHEAMALPCDLFQLMVKNSVLEELEQTREGRQYLADCRRLETTEPDLDSLRKLIKGGGDGNGP